MAEFLGCTCCQDSGDVMDWTNTYALPKHRDPEAQAKGGPGVRIPLPFSRTWDPSQDKIKPSHKARK